MADKKKAPVAKPPAVFNAAEMVRLVAKDNVEFVIHRDCAMVSKTLKERLAATPPTNKALAGTISLPTIDGDLLERVVQYFYYKRCHEVVDTQGRRIGE